jgi:hypothetical protein
VGGGPWNGFATIAETYRAYDPADQRRSVWLAGPQVNFVTNRPTTDRAGAPLVFTDTIGDATRANENEGARINKFPPLLTAPTATRTRTTSRTSASRDVPDQGRGAQRARQTGRRSRCINQLARACSRRRSR